eukprot:3403934-Rhodomonas_salina.2
MTWDVLPGTTRCRWRAEQTSLSAGSILNIRCAMPRTDMGCAALLGWCRSRRRTKLVLRPSA